MDGTPTLTISIPTFNRPRQLRRTLERLIPQLDGTWVLHINDNCCVPPVREAHADLLSALPPEQLVIFRNEVNVGAIANVLRCFERCSTEWVVVLGDDDEVLPNFATTFVNAAAEQPMIVFANFGSSLFVRPAAFTTTGVEEFAQGIDNWSNVLFISTNLFNCKLLLPYIRYGYMYGYSLAPHIALVLQYLKEEGGICLFACPKVVNHQKDPDVVSWSLIYANNFALILELLPDRHSQEKLFLKMRTYFLAPKEMAIRLAETACATGADQRLQFRLRSSCYTCMEESVVRALKRVLLENALRYPRVVVRLAKQFARGRAPSNEKDLQSGM